MRLVLVTGKGGVGKTTLAAATGINAAHRGVRTLLVSTDAAHSLGDVLDVRLGPEPARIDANLDGLHLDGRRAQVGSRWAWWPGTCAACSAARS